MPKGIMVIDEEPDIVGIVQNILKRVQPHHSFTNPIEAIHEFEGANVASHGNRYDLYSCFWPHSVIALHLDGRRTAP